jgi:hypothetical protein
MHLNCQKVILWAELRNRSGGLAHAKTDLQNAGTGTA